VKDVLQYHDENIISSGVSRSRRGDVQYPRQQRTPSRNWEIFLETNGLLVVAGSTGAQMCGVSAIDLAILLWAISWNVLYAEVSFLIQLHPLCELF
jgi:hypothetical protein